MCGIAGYYSFGNTLPDKEQITTMFSLLESRGRDASGYAYVNNEELKVNKAPIRSSEMVMTTEWKKLTLPRTMILHARAKTQGSEKNNANNHPLYNKQGLCIVHNGIIYNDREIFGKDQIRHGEVDSEAILAVLSSKGKGDKIKRVFERLEGSFSFAAIDKVNPEQLVLIKKDNPLDLYYNVKDDILYFCSERDIMREALGISSNSKRGFNTGEGDYHYYEMENNYALILNSEGVELYKKYSPRKDSWLNRNYNLYINKDDELLIECPWCNEMTLFYPGKLINRCRECGMKINEEDIVYV